MPTKHAAVFYSWESDAPAKTNRYFIEKALELAIKNGKKDVELQAAIRDAEVHLDKDTKGISGTPPIAQTILTKIDKCTAFVSDITFVGKSMSKLKLSKKNQRFFPNPNVLIEYGYALAKIGHHRIITVMNTAFGECNKQNLPFDLQHLRWPITYCLEDDQAEIKKLIFDQLVKDLSGALKAILIQPAEESQTFAVRAFINPPSIGLIAIVGIEIENCGQKSAKSLTVKITHDESNCVAYRESADWTRRPNDSSINPRVLRSSISLNPGDKSIIMTIPLCERSILPFHISIQITAEDSKPTILFCEITDKHIQQKNNVSFSTHFIEIKPTQKPIPKLHIPASSLAKDIINEMLDHSQIDERGLIEIEGSDTASDSCFIANTKTGTPICSANKSDFKSALTELVEAGWLLPVEAKNRNGIKTYKLSPDADKSL